MIRVFLTFICVFSFHPIWSQTFGRTYGDSLDNKGGMCWELPDSNYMVYGTYIDSTDTTRAMLIKTNRLGDVIWIKKLPFRSGLVLQTNDYGYLLSYRKNSLYVDSTYFTLVKLDSTGNHIFTNNFSCSPWHTMSSTAQYPDGNYLMVGMKHSGSALPPDKCWMMADTNGNLIWVKISGGGWIYDVKIDSLGFAIMCGSDYYQLSPPGFLFMKLKPDGTVLWHDEYHVDWWEHQATSVDFSLDGGYIFTGYKNTIYPDKITVVLKYSSYGGLIWMKTYLENYTNSTGNYIHSTSDSCYLLTGEVDSDLYLMKINSDGEVLWTRIFSGNNRDFGACIKETADDFILVSGTTASYGNGGYDIYFIKTDNEGIVTDIDTVVQPPKESYLYPNPSGLYSGFYIQSSDFYNTMILELFDLTGRSVHSQSVRSGRNDWSTPVKEGFYLYRITCKEKLLARGKIIIQTTTNS